jgi:hypothetical protein
MTTASRIAEHRDADPRSLAPRCCGTQLATLCTAVLGRLIDPIGRGPKLVLSALVDSKVVPVDHRSSKDGRPLPWLS